MNGRHQLTDPECPCCRLAGTARDRYHRWEAHRAIVALALQHGSMNGAARAYAAAYGHSFRTAQRMIFRWHRGHVVPRELVLDRLTVLAGILPATYVPGYAEGVVATA